MRELSGLSFASSYFAWFAVIGTAGSAAIKFGTNSPSVGAEELKKIG